jgi:hypothetical protein
MAHIKDPIAIAAGDQTLLALMNATTFESDRSVPRLKDRHPLIKTCTSPKHVAYQDSGTLPQGRLSSRKKMDMQERRIGEVAPKSMKPGL